MLRKIIQYFFLSLVLLLVFLSSALLAMRFAIQGREVRVPRLTGLTPAEAERIANSTAWCSPLRAVFITQPCRKGESFRNRQSRIPLCAEAGRFAWLRAWGRNAPLCQI